MEHKLAENIRKYRKERQMTQEELAEKLNLTVGTISKWERGSSEPELSYLMQLAQIFHVSLDALLDFSIQGNNADVLMEKIGKLLNAREFEEVKKECEAALLIYPNYFMVVAQVANAYYVIGTMTKEKEALHKAIKYFTHSIDLFSQNSDPQISITLLQNHIAGCYLALDETQKGIDQMKKNNICGINDADIAVNMIVTLRQNKEGFEYAQKAFLSSMSKMINVLLAIMTYDINEKKPQDGLRTVEKAVEYMNLLKDNREGMAFVDKYVASAMLLSAVFHDMLGEWDAAKADVLKAIEQAEAFDKEPCFNVKNIIFVDNVEDGYIYDSLGLTAKQGLVSMMEEFHLKESVSDRFLKYFRKEIGQEESTL
ncbi:MAG: helix-turn-helix transcriptional regulator [Lachnospiraceae bacterium]|nr:helix-turn-helix transcriptional regulator [Lachnospiraceae bacterium]